MADENPNPHEPVPPAGQEPVPPAQQPVPPAEQAPVPPAQQQYPVPPADPQPVPPAQHPVPPAQQPVPPAQQPVPPAGASPVPPAQNPVPPVDPNAGYPQQPGFDTIQPGALPPLNQPPPNNPQPNLPPVNAPAVGAGAGAAAGGRRGGRRPATKKKRPATKGARPGAYRKPVAQDSGISFGSVMLAILGAAMLAASIFALLPTDLSSLEGYPADDMTNKEPKNLLAAGQALLGDRTKNVSFTEKEVNDYLNYRLQGNQTGALGGIMKVRGIYVDLRPNEAEIFIERSFPLLGRTTISTVVKSEFNQIKRQQFWKLGGGSIGKIKLKDRSLQPVLNAFLRMSRIGSEELEVMNYMANVEIGENTIALESSL